VYEGLFRHDDWNIGIVHAPINDFLDADLQFDFHWLPKAGPNKYLADPFGLIVDDVLYVFCEEFDYSTFKGRIVYIEVHGNQSPSEPKVAIDLSVHASYPYLLECDGAIYCVPETSSAKEVALYRAERFPNKWRKVTNLVSGFAALDSTIFQYDGKWWLACTNDEEGSSLKLYLWYSSDLLSKWRPHPSNPVKVDIRSSRPAGTPFFLNGTLYRPAQDSSTTYGGRIVINRVLKLDVNEFQEEQAAVVGPYLNSPYPDGAHTLSSVDDLTLVDAKSFVFNPNAFWHELRDNAHKVHRKLVGRPWAH